MGRVVSDIYVDEGTYEEQQESDKEMLHAVSIERDALEKALKDRGIEALVIFDPVFLEHTVTFSAWDAAKLLGLVDDSG